MKKFFVFISLLIIISAIGIVGYVAASSYHPQLRAALSAKDGATRKKAVLTAVEFEKTHIKALTGDTNAQYKTGRYMVDGTMGFKSPDKAVPWFRMAAEKGHTRAQLAMARYCFTGDGVQQSDAEGAKWAKMAAENGQAEARGLLGTLYIGAVGMKQDLQEGMKWLKDAKDSEALQRGADLQGKLDSFAALTPEERRMKVAALGEEVKMQIAEGWAKVKEDLVKLDDTTPDNAEPEKK
jgi:TPR repeat protein